MAYLTCSTGAFGSDLDGPANRHIPSWLPSTLEEVCTYQMGPNLGRPDLHWKCVADSQGGGCRLKSYVFHHLRSFLPTRLSMTH